ncbi:unnamed protein product [Urochloa humidicola]
MEMFHKEAANQMKVEHIQILVKEFFRGPSAKCSIEDADMSVLERWFKELGVGWVLHLVDGAPAGRLDQSTLGVSSWIRALTEIMDIFCLMTSLFPGHGSVDEEEPSTESEEQDMTEQAQFASFTQQALLKLLAFVDFTDALSLSCDALIGNRAFPPAPARYEKLHALLQVRYTLSKALSQIRYSSPSAEVERILGEIVSVLSAKEAKVGEAIWTQVEEIRTRILESIEDAEDPSYTQTIRGLSGIHKATSSMMAYVRFLLDGGVIIFSSVASVVSEAASRGKYVPQIGDETPLRSLAAEMVSSVQEKLANKSEALFPDQSRRFLFLINNSSFILNQLCYPYNFTGSLKAAFSEKEEGYIESYIQVSWAPVLACLSNPTPRRLGKKYSPLHQFESKFQKTCATQKLWKVPYPGLRKKLREAIIDKIVPGYTKYIEGNKKTTPKFTPQNLEEMLQELFEG